MRDLWIHEAFYGYGEVRCYLGVVVEGGEGGENGKREKERGQEVGGEVVVVFPVSIPFIPFEEMRRQIEEED